VRELLSRSASGGLFRPAATAAEVPWLGFHGFRHTCATALFREGRNVKQVQAWLGHHSPAFTLETYVHLLPQDLSEPRSIGVAALAGGRAWRPFGDPKPRKRPEGREREIRRLAGISGLAGS
jgi:Phage integrase family